MADSLESINIALSKEEKMKLLGRIDRVDTCEEEDKVLVKVIDYKSGNTSFDLLALYHGLQLQLVLYMNAAMELEQRNHPDKQVVPAGIFYYNIKTRGGEDRRGRPGGPEPPYFKGTAHERPGIFRQGRAGKAG